MRIPTLAPRHAVPWILLASVGLATSWTVERRSEERGNRLHREGALPGAVAIYDERIAGDSVDQRLRYNLGTTLLRQDAPGAGTELALGTASDDAEVRVRGLYNLGLWNLLQAQEANAADSAVAFTLASVEASKGALRLNPGRADARWNLALAQRMLDSIESSDGRAGTESVEGAADADDLVRTDEARELQDESPVGDGPQDGETETVAESDLVAPLTLLEADDILGSGHLDASPMIRKLLAFEGRAQRRNRFGRTTPRW